MKNKIIRELIAENKKLKEKIEELDNDLCYYMNLSEDMPMRMEYEDLD